MSADRYPHLYQKINEALTERSKSDLLIGCMKRGRDTRAAALELLPEGAAFRDDVRQAKERCIEEHADLKKQFIENARKRGTIVYEAKTGADVISYCLDLAQSRGAKFIAKSKSLTTEEIELNHPLVEAGIDVVETDLGELIIQLVNEAGLLGHKLSSAVGEPLFTKFKEASIDAIVTESSVCSIQLFEGTSIQVYHPLQLLGCR